MRLSIPQYATALLELEKEGNATDTASQFFAWLTRRGEGKKMGKIIKEAERILRAQSGITDVVITTAYEVDGATREMLLKQAKDVFTYQSVDARFVTDGSLIGGMKMRSETVLYDATVSTAVRKLRATLAK